MPLRNGSPDGRRPGPAEQVRFTHLERLVWPDEGITKGDMIAYYRDVSSLILPYLRDRPLRIHRHTKGIYGKGFWQNDMGQVAPEWAKTASIYSESDGREIDYFVCQDPASLLYLANLDCIELNPWHARLPHLGRPDYVVFDLDPLGAPFAHVAEAALTTSRLLDGVGAPSYCKTSGGLGLHVYVPLGRRYSHEQAGGFARLINVLINARRPATTSVARRPGSRGGLVYLDFLQNGYGRALAAPYCLRPRKGAPVSTPLLWGEVGAGLDPAKFTLKTARDRFARVGDLWKGVLGEGIDMAACLDRLQKVIVERSGTGPGAEG